MLEFKKIGDYNSTSFTTTGLVLVCVRLAKGKGHRLILNLDGTIGMLGQRVNDVMAMSDDDFVLYSEIQFSGEANDDTSLPPAN